MNEKAGKVAGHSASDLLFALHLPFESEAARDAGAAMAGFS